MPDVKVFIVEDEFIHAEHSKLSVAEAGFEVSGEIDNADLALEAIQKAKPDVVLMDISLPGKENGITLSKKLRARSGPPVIFTTSFNDSETIEEAAASGPVSYLVKPVSADNLKAAVTLAMAQKPKHVESELEIQNGAIFIKSGNRLQKILISDILWIEAAGDNYCKLVTEQHQLVSRHTVKAMIKELNRSEFVQTHRAYVVNKNKIESINEKEQVLSIGQDEIPIGRTYKDALYQLLRKL